ncbi:MAG TPA: tetratricopeptide repeat protein [Thioploca sp.]|nr:tetratricopeptide repeat protein [Thioploca sp.]
MIIFKLILLLSISSMAYANNWFQNSEQQGKIAFDQKNYAEAVKLFNDPYKRGVALYRDGKYIAAAEAFAKVNNPEVNLDAQYNLGNSYFQQQEYKKAIQAYEQVLKVQPDHDDAKYNLDLAKQQLEKSQDSNQQDSESENSDDKKEQSESNSEQSQSSDSSENSEQSKQDSKSAQDKQTDSQQNSQSEDKQMSEDMKDKQENPMSAENNNESDESSEQTAASSTMMQESDMMADALLERIKENPQQLLRGQFYIDAHNSKQPPPDKPW